MEFTESEAENGGDEEFLSARDRDLRLCSSVSKLPVGDELEFVESNEGNRGEESLSPEALSVLDPDQEPAIEPRQASDCSVESKRFATVFSQDKDSMPSVWTGKEDIRAITTDACFALNNNAVNVINISLGSILAVLMQQIALGSRHQ